MSDPSTKIWRGVELQLVTEGYGAGARWTGQGLELLKHTTRAWRASAGATDDGLDVCRIYGYGVNEKAAMDNCDAACRACARQLLEGLDP
jgi:hypothetical protein